MAKVIHLILCRRRAVIDHQHLFILGLSRCYHPKRPSFNLTLILEWNDILAIFSWNDISVFIFKKLYFYGPIVKKSALIN